MDRRASLVSSGTAFGPLRSFALLRGSCNGWSGKRACGQPAALRWSGLRFAPTALRAFAPSGANACARRGTVRRDCSTSGRTASVSRPRRRTRCVHFVHCAQTAATSQFSKRAARAAASPALLGAPEARRRLPASPFAEPVVVRSSRTHSGSARWAVRLAGSLNGAEERSPVVGARSALRGLTRRRCLNAVSAANEVSSAPRPRGEHHRGVGAKRRPPLREPARRTDRCAAPPLMENSGTRRSATGRKPTSALAISRPATKVALQ